MAASPTSLVAFGTQHAETEADLRASGIPRVQALRNGFYTASLAHMVGAARETGQLVTPPAGPVAWTSPADLARANARLVVAADAASDRAFPAAVDLTGARAYDWADVARALSSAWARPVEHVVVSPAAFRERLVGDQGMPAPFADFFLGAYAAMAAGEFARVDPTLRSLLGRAPQTVEDFFAQEGEH